MRAEAIRGMSPSQLKHKYALFDVPTEYSIVRPPVGTRIRRGRVAKIKDSGEGAIQYQFLHDWQPSWFTDRRPINGS